MNIRPKTKRRLLILLILSMLALAGLTAIMIVHGHRDAVAFRQLHDQAMEAYKAGDYPNAVSLLQDYLSKTTEPDPDAIFAFAKSRSRVPLPQGRHLTESIRSFTNYLDAIRPGDEAAEHELLKVYIQAGRNVEAGHLADAMLEKNPRDPDVLWQKVWSLVGQTHFADALAVNLKLNEIDPLNLTAQEETLALMARLNDPPTKLIGHAKALRDAHNQDPRFEVLLAAAYMQAHQDEEGRKWLQTAATRVAPDAQFVLAMVASLDKVGLYSDAADFLVRAADSMSDAAVQRLLAQRLWQNRKFADLESRLKSQDPAAANTDSLLAGYRALALYAQNKYSDAAKIVDGLALRSDAASVAWTIGLRAAFALPAPNATDRVTRLQQAVARDEQNPVLHLFLAQSYLRTGEADLTIEQCDQAYQLAPSWAMPHVVAVDALIANGRNHDAVATAREACERSPDHFDAQAALARASYALACETGRPADYAATLRLLEQTSLQDPATLPTYVAALSRAGKRDEAIAAALAATKAEPALSTSVLTNLAEIADAENLDLGSEIRDAARKVGGTTPELAYADARTLLGAGKTQEGLTSLLEAASGHETEIAWRMVIADYKEVSGEGNALADWTALGEEHPENLQLQQTILRAPSRFKDRAFWDRTIERLKKLTGEQGIAWRIERGRWLLSGDLGERDKAEAVNILTQITHIAPGLSEPHRLLALAMEKVSNNPGAISELTAAAEARPGDLTITRELVGLLVSAHRNSEALTYLDKLAHSPRLSRETREWIVNAYVEQGATDKALAALTIASGDESQSVDHRMMLARLQRLAGRNDDAAKIYSELLDAVIPEAAFWTDAADFFADRHDMNSAQRCLEKLSALPLAAGELEVDRGQFAEQWLGDDEALKHFRAATAGAAKSPAAWGTLVGFLIRRGQYTEATNSAGEGLKSLPANGSLKKLASVAHSLESLANPQNYQILIDALARRPEDAGLNEMLSEVVAAQAGGLDANAVARRLREIADHYPTNVSMAAQAVQTQLRVGRFDVALGLAARVAQANPNSADAQRLLTEIYAAAGDWTHAEQSALLWRQRSMDHPLNADIALARIYLRGDKKDPGAAIHILEPHIAPPGSAQNPAAMNLYLTAMILSGKSDDAAALLKPLTSESAWRTAWLDLAESFPDAAAAMAWIEQIRPAIPPDALNERYALASAQYRVGVKFDSSDVLQVADQTLSPALSEDNVSTQAWLLAAQIAHARENYLAAENAYRRVLKIDPASAMAMNNLAYVLLIEGRQESLSEALKLAQAAVAAQPGDAGYYDTLARIEERSGHQAAAIQNFRNALVHDSNSLEAMIGLADLLSRNAATRPEAKILIQRIQPQFNANSRLPLILRRQYEATRDALASSL